ncbi:hypothetical protein BH20CHL5_BH20CHL5_02300 [soil metagenome]
MEALTDSPDPSWYLILVLLLILGGVGLVAAAWWARER